MTVRFQSALTSGLLSRASFMMGFSSSINSLKNRKGTSTLPKQKQTEKVNWGLFVDHWECHVPEGHGVGPAKPQHKGLCDVHALRAHHWNNVFEQGGGGRSANNLLPDTEKAIGCKCSVLPCFPQLPDLSSKSVACFVYLRPCKCAWSLHVLLTLES